MYLKRLELQGFKSFATKTVFDFGTGITAVVGPNGSGKSNIAESIRWVLGESTSRSVRARRLEDVIFSGSSQKAAVGMAEVSITLDNSEGWLPVDYSEVVVSRRAYRSGESDYLINKTKVRLRDVLDLFLRAQIGQNSYAFMGQGLVDEVLVMRPEERRRLLEEAADVRLLRSRLDEARDRLAATRENLERVQLLIDEIGPRLKQLERQASRAAEHGLLARELADTLRELYTQLWGEAQTALAAARAGYDQKQQELTVSRDEVKACEEGLAALSGALEEREKELSTRRARQRAVEDQVHTLEQRLVFDKERLEGQGTRRTELEAELASLKEERGDLQRSIAQAQERGRAVIPEIEEAKALIATRRQELNALEQEQSGLRRRIVEAEEKLGRAQRGVGEATAGLARLAEEEARVEGDSLRRQSRRREIVEQFLAMRRELRSNRERVFALEAEVADAEKERAGLVAAVEGGRTDVRTLETQSMQLQTRVAQLMARQEILLRLQGAQEGVDAGVRYLLGDDEERRNAAEGLIGMVRDIIRVPPGLERAIEAALAENVQALVFDDLDAAQAALDLLENEEAGRAVVFSLDSIKLTPPLNLIHEKGVIGVASKLVRCDNHFRVLVDVLLGKTIVVESVALARGVLRRGLGSVVTMDGVLLRPNGAISGGLSKATTESFGRQRELDELPPEIAQAESRLQDVTLRLAREQEDLDTAMKALSAIEPNLQKLRDERSRRQSSLLESRGRLVLLRSEARSLWAEMRRGGEGQDWRGRRNRLTAEREAFEAEIKEVEAMLPREREELAAVSTKRNEAIDTVSEAAAAHADLEGEGRSLVRQIELLQSSLSRTDGQLKSREEGLKAIEAEARTLQERSGSGVIELDKAREELTNLSVDLEPAEGELAHLQARERSMREQLSTARTRMLEAERSFLEAESAVKLRGEEIEGLQEMIAGEGFRIEGSSILTGGATASTEQTAGRLPPIRGGADVDVNTLRKRISELRGQIRGLGPVNEQAAVDYNESKERYDFLTGQVEDLTGSEQTLLTAIDELETNIRERLKTTFAVVDREFQRYFESFFNGGKAHLSLTQPEDFANTGIDIVASPPGKRVNSLAMLSGGERTLTALALLLSLLEAHPSPICVLDEVDAALDETNVGRFVDALRALEKKTQFVIITHNPRTVEAADYIYGVSMGSDNTSKVLSVRLGDPGAN